MMRWLYEERKIKGLTGTGSEERDAGLRQPPQTVFSYP